MAASGRRRDSLISALIREWDRPVAPEALAAARAISARYGDAVAGVLFYGSCLRTGEIEDKILDFYIIVDSYKSAYDSIFLRLGNALVPPNVFYHEMDVDGTTVRSKYAVLSRKALTYRCSADCLNVSVWARFCQPVILLEARDDAITTEIATAISHAATTMLGNALPLVKGHYDAEKHWVTAFEATYAAELRSEKAGKGKEIFDLDAERYRALHPYVLDAMGVDDEKLAAQVTVRVKPALGVRLKWWQRRFNGKLESILRLIKASFTFQGGIDYLAWKIRRHAGVEIEVTPWMRKHPVIAGLGMLPKLRKKGAFR